MVSLKASLQKLVKLLLKLEFQYLFVTCNIKKALCHVRHFLYFCILYLLIHPVFIHCQMYLMSFFCYNKICFCERMLLMGGKHSVYITLFLQ